MPAMLAAPPQPDAAPVRDAVRAAGGVLPDDHPYLANLSALWAVDPELAAQIDAIDDADCYATEVGRKGDVTVAVESGGGGKLYLHSRHDPRDEAERLIKSADAAGKVAFVVHGYGLGYHVRALAAAASPEAMIAVLEPDIRMLATGLRVLDLADVIASGVLIFVTQPDKAALFARLAPRSALLTMGLTTVSHAPSVRIAPDFHREMGQWVNDYVAFQRTNINTLVLNGARTARNISRSIGWYAAAGGVTRLKDSRLGLPAVVVSAGPSLRKNGHLLPGLVGKAVIIAVQTTLKPLLEMGVTPDYVTSLDYHEICARFFEGLPPGLTTELVVEPKATPLVMAMHPGPVSMVGSDFADGLLREMAGDLGKARLTAGATVAHLAFYLARHLGCDPILFVGQDLGFGDGMCYAPGTSYDDVWRPELGRFCSVEMKQWEQIARERAILRRVPGHDGNPIYTEERLFTYLQQFERDFADCPARILDCTEGGVLKRGAAPMPLAEAIEKFCQRPLPPMPAAAKARPGFDWSRLPRAADCIRARRAEAAEMATIATDTLPLLAEIRDHLADQARVNRTIARIDVLRARMNTHGQTYDLVNQLVQAAELDRFQADRRIEAERVTGADKQRRQVERDIANVRAMGSAATEFATLMDETLDRLAAQAAEHTVTLEAA